MWTTFSETGSVIYPAMLGKIVHFWLVHALAVKDATQKPSLIT